MPVPLRAFWAFVCITFLCDGSHASWACAVFNCGPVFSSPQNPEGGLHPGVACRLGPLHVVEWETEASESSKAPTRQVGLYQTKKAFARQREKLTE